MMNNPISQPEEQVIKILSDAIIHLISHRNKQEGNWDDVRSTSLALWAINAIFPNKVYNKSILKIFQNDIRNATKWLTTQAKSDEIDGYSWGFEAWDTALSIIALSFDDKYKKEIGQARSWLKAIIDNKTGVWYDEVWETTLSTIALLRSERLHKGPVQSESWSWLLKVLRWLISIPSKPDGEFVCPHYSGFLVWLLGEIQASRAYRQISETEIFKEYNIKVDNAKNWLFEWIISDKENLWSSYTFSNSYIIIGLTSLKKPLEQRYYNKFISWYDFQKGEHGGFEDTEDTSLAILAMSFIMGDLKIDKDKLINELSNNNCFNEIITKKCFFGYSGKAEKVAKTIINHLENYIESLEVKDWQKDFQIGRILINEIQDKCKDSDAAIFLFTKDDELADSSNSLLTHSPRDNVVFEFGYYAGKLGIEKTILIVEEGTKVPIDLNGVIHIPLKNREDLNDVLTATANHLKNIIFTK
jgi:predicted nucleotide-binding protein